MILNKAHIHSSATSTKCLIRRCVLLLFFPITLMLFIFLLLLDVSLTELTFLLLQNVRTRQFYRKVHLVLTVVFELQPTKPVRRADFQMLRAVSLALFYRGEIKLSISSILSKTTLTFYCLFLRGSVTYTHFD